MKLTSLLLVTLALSSVRTAAAQTLAPPAVVTPSFDDISLSAEGPSAPATTSTTDDDSSFRELSRYARKKLLSLWEQERATDLVERLGHRRPFRRAVAKLLNRDGAKLDRWVNEILMARAWKKHGSLPNLASLDDGVMRGGEPTPDGFRELYHKGVRTVINLRMEDQSERSLVGALGMRYVFIPIPDTDAPTVAQAEWFLTTCGTAKPEAKVFFHCAAGTYRTGTMAAVYRVAHGKSAEDALAEAATFGWMESWLNADREADFVRTWAETYPASTKAKATRFGRPVDERGTAPEAP